MAGSTWYACKHPERPMDPFVVWHYHGCRSCRVAASALRMRNPDDQHVQWLNTVMEEEGVC